MANDRKLILVLLIVLVVGIVGLAIGGVFAVRRAATGIGRALHSSGLDNQFGDQWLKTAVAQIELHKLRYGHYPRSLQDLRFLSPMDQAILYNVAYYPNQDLSAYYVEVRTGFVGKPTLGEYPDEFWQGTGFKKELKPLAESTTVLPKPN